MSFDTFDTDHFTINIYRPKIVLVSLTDPSKEKRICEREKDFEKTIWLIVKNFKIKKDDIMSFLSRCCFLDHLKYLVGTLDPTYFPHQHNGILRWGAEAGQLPVVRYALEQGADIHTFQDYALRHAADGGFLDCVKYLVEQGAEISADDYGAQKWALERNHLKVAEYLCDLRK